MSLLASLISPSMIFLPPKPPTYKTLPELFHLKVANDNSIAAIYLKNKNAKYTIIYSHGNAADLGIEMSFLKALYQHGFSVISYDYEGYGQSTGSASEKNTYQDIETIYHYLVADEKVSPKQIILMGHSLGAGVTTELATEKSVAGVILASPFLSTYRVLTQIPLLLFDKYNNINKVKKIDAPILIIHGHKDTVVPFWQGKALYEAANKPKTFLAIKEAGHNNLASVGQAQYWQAIKNFTLSLH
ncbi:alpha/beta hydrolase [bacterium SCSIO 12844]|nr:alpha/beta hydrolase [bacterium SCSIO 12844]